MSIKFSQHPSRSRPQTQKQRAQWDRFNFLGNCIGLARWVNNKCQYGILQYKPHVEGKTLAEDDLRFQIDYHSSHLQAALYQLAQLHGFKEKS